MTIRAFLLPVAAALLCLATAARAQDSARARNSVRAEHGAARDSVRTRDPVRAQRAGIAEDSARATSAAGAQDSGRATVARGAHAYADVAGRIMEAALADSSAYARMVRLVDRFGNRPVGSARLEAAIDWIIESMRADGLANVRGEPVRVPHWERGSESAELVAPRRARLHMLGLGRSVGTRAKGITAPVLVVGSFDELARRAAEARGKIVLFDVPFATDRNPFDVYDDVVRYRVDGASAAARAGAVAALVRSVASYSIQSPHTGTMRYDSTTRRIPTAALSVEDAELIHRLSDAGARVVVRLRMGARMLADATSRNVVAELPGRERPDEVVVVGGHIDSWDVGEGAMDDAGGAVASWEAVRLLRRLGLTPRRTVRVVLWTNEEMGGRGGLAYRDRHAAELDRHVLAVETDNGVFAPRGFAFAGSDAAASVLRQVAALLDRVGPVTVERSAESPDADLEPLVDGHVPAIGLRVDPSRYFWFHHSEADTPDKLDPAEMARCVAALAVLTYVVADLPEPLPRVARATR